MSASLSFDFSEKIALVTGASQGIGLAIAQAFHKSGATVHITGTRADASEYASDLSAFTYHQADMADPGQRERLCRDVGAIDVLVNNAGLSNPRGAEFEMEGFRHTLEIDLVAPADLAFKFAASLAERRGSVINIGSAACFLAVKDVPSYTASKAGLLGLTRSLADKWAPKGVRVNLVAPGYVATKLTSDFHENETFTKNLEKIIPLHRWGEPEEMAPPVLFLASDAASYITGQAIVADGGLMLR